MEDVVGLVVKIVWQRVGEMWRASEVKVVSSPGSGKEILEVRGVVSRSSFSREERE